MADVVNTARIDGNYNDETPMWMETAVTVQTAEITLEKTANHQIWAEGPLTYTIVMTNTEEVPVTGVTLLDTLDITQVVFDPVVATVQVNEDPAVEVVPAYEPTTGEVLVDIGDVAAGARVTVTFQVEKA